MVLTNKDHFPYISSKWLVLKSLVTCETQGKSIRRSRSLSILIFVLKKIQWTWLKIMISSSIAVAGSWQWWRHYVTQVCFRVQSCVPWQHYDPLKCGPNYQPSFVSTVLVGLIRVINVYSLNHLGFSSLTHLKKPCSSAIKYKTTTFISIICPNRFHLA